jgi:Tat protein translocase TatB subunit
MFNIGVAEMFVILVVALLVLGPKNLPDALRTAGRVMGEVRRISRGFQEELRKAVEVPDVPDGPDIDDDLPDDAEGSVARRQAAGDGGEVGVAG